MTKLKLKKKFKILNKEKKKLDQYYKEINKKKIE